MWKCCVHVKPPTLNMNCHKTQNVIRKSDSGPLFEQILLIVNIYCICAWLVVSSAFARPRVSGRQQQPIHRAKVLFVKCVQPSFHTFGAIVLGLFSISFIILCVHLQSRFYLVVCLWPFATVSIQHSTGMFFNYCDSRYILYSHKHE